MPISKSALYILSLVTASMLAATSNAFDGARGQAVILKTPRQTTTTLWWVIESRQALEQGKSANDAAHEAFRAGNRAFFKGKVDKAVDAFKHAANAGHTMAKWKLANMYASGKGVNRSDKRAFELYRNLIATCADDHPQSVNAPFLANAYAAIGSYYLHGIKEARLQPDKQKAVEILNYAASYYGYAKAQYELAMLYINDQDMKDALQAARWLKLASAKGYVRAQRNLGDMLFYGKGIAKNTEEGLMWLTIAHSLAEREESDMVEESYERAFSLAKENVRRKAMELASSWLSEQNR